MTRNFSRAFTLFELLVVVVIIAILASIAYPVYTGVLERAKVTKDMNNLRQIGIATQLYMNDNDGALFSPATSWMSQLNPKYVSAWGIFQSPFDTRGPSEAGTAAPVSPISYGINFNVYQGGAAISADKISKPTIFILFAPAQALGATVSFQGAADTAPPGVTVDTGGSPAASSPGGTAIGGTQNTRTRINALFADLHCETMPWGGAGVAFTNNTANPPSDPDGNLRWNPF
jgi:prepilin-type N-terminal cleavage/methylation domain-containing protein